PLVPSRSTNCVSRARSVRAFPGLMAGKPRARAIRTRAFAKINLSLQVGPRRRDGYHAVRTLLQSIALHDTLSSRAIEGPFRLTCPDRGWRGDAPTLVWKAAARLGAAARRRGEPRGAHIRLVKRIPLQAGLGGGSSDAAAALRALNALWHANVS